MKKRIPTLKPIFDNHFGKYLENRPITNDEQWFTQMLQKEDVYWYFYQ